MSTDTSPVQSWQPSALEEQRRAYRRRASTRSVLIAAISSVVIIVGLVVGIGSTPGWPRVQQTFFDPQRAIAAFPDVLRGLWLNVRVLLICGVLIVVLGMIIAIMRTLKGAVFFPLRVLAAAYTDLFRGLPLLLVILMLGFGIPALRLQGLPKDAIVWGGLALVLTYSAYVAEVFRAGIESVHPSQRAAARSLGLSYAQTMRFVVVPQAVRRVLPPLLNDLVAITKDTGLISVLGVVYDAVLNAKIQTAQTYNYTPYVVAGLLFIAITIPLTRFTDWVAKRQGWNGSGGTV